MLRYALAISALALTLSTAHAATTEPEAIRVSGDCYTANLCKLYVKNDMYLTNVAPNVQAQQVLAKAIAEHQHVAVTGTCRTTGCALEAHTLNVGFTATYTEGGTIDGAQATAILAVITAKGVETSFATFTKVMTAVTTGIAQGLTAPRSND